MPQTLPLRRKHAEHLVCCELWDPNMRLVELRPYVAFASSMVIKLHAQYAKSSGSTLQDVWPMRCIQATSGHVGLWLGFKQNQLYILPKQLGTRKEASNFAAGCYITQTQEGETRPLVYNSFTLLPAEQNYDTYRRELAAIVKFTKKYSHMLNAEYQSVVYTDYKPLVGFLNAEYHN